MSLPAQAPPPTLQSLFESGQYGQLLGRVNAEKTPSPQDLYLAGQSARKLDPPDDVQALNWLGRLGGADTDAWTFVGRSAAAVVNGDTARRSPTDKAVKLAPTNFYARYQLGLAYAEAKDYKNGATTLEKATTMNPSFAYAQYDAGIEVLPAEAHRQDGGVLRALPEARPERARAPGDRVADAEHQGTLANHCRLPILCQLKSVLLRSPT